MKETLVHLFTVCILIGVENASVQGSLLPYVEGGALGALAYAQVCSKDVLPFVDFIQASVMK